MLDDPNVVDKFKKKTKKKTDPVIKSNIFK